MDAAVPLTWVDTSVLWVVSNAPPPVLHVEGKLTASFFFFKELLSPLSRQDSRHLCMGLFLQDSLLVQKNTTYHLLSWSVRCRHSRPTCLCSPGFPSPEIFQGKAVSKYLRSVEALLTRLVVRRKHHPYLWKCEGDSRLGNSCLQRKFSPISCPFSLKLFFFFFLLLFLIRLSNHES